MQSWYKKGSWLAVCDSCGRRFKAEQLMKRWDGLMVCEEDWEVRHPQDFLRGIPDHMETPWTRPEGEDQFVAGGFCTVTGLSAIPGFGIPGCMIPARFFTG